VVFVSLQSTLLKDLPSIDAGWVTLARSTIVATKSILRTGVLYFEPGLMPGPFTNSGT
jgi:hypothetical protein